MRARVIAVAFVVGLVATLTATGQSNPVQPTRLALEVYFYPNEPPGYVVVPPATTLPVSEPLAKSAPTFLASSALTLPSGGSWFTRFPRVPGWTAPAGSLQVDAVNFRSTMDGDTVRISVSVFKGIRHEQEKDVAVYTLREGEKVRIQELYQFGVEPFELKLVRVGSSAADLPAVISQAKSIELVTIQSRLSTLPSYRVVLRNLSGKNVSAIEFKVKQGDRTLLSGMPQGQDGEPLILAGGVSEVIAPGATRATATPGGYEPVAPPNQHIEITMVVFEDGSFEGDIESAASFRAFVKGRKIQLRRLVDVFQAILEDNGSSPSGALEMLRNKVNALGIETDSLAMQELTSEFSSLAEKPTRDLTLAIEASMSMIRRDAQQGIAQFQLNNPKPEVSSFRFWLVAAKQRYEAWLAHL